MFGIDKIEVKTKDNEVLGVFDFDNNSDAAQQEFVRFKSLVKNYELAPNPSQTIQIDLDKL